MFSPSQARSRASNSSAAASMASRADNEVGVARAAAQLANKIPRSGGMPSARVAARVPEWTPEVCRACFNVNEGAGTRVSVGRITR